MATSLNHGLSEAAEPSVPGTCAPWGPIRNCGWARCPYDSDSALVGRIDQAFEQCAGAVIFVCHAKTGVVSPAEVSVETHRHQFNGIDSKPLQIIQPVQYILTLWPSSKSRISNS